MVKKKTKRRFFCTITSVLFAFCLLGVGLVVCCVPQITTFLCLQNCGKDANSIFTTTQLARAGLVTRDYTIDTNDIDPVMQIIQDINREQQTPYASASQVEIMNCGDDKYTLTPNAISHLDDVFAVVGTAKGGLIVAAFATLALVIYIGRHFGKRSVAAVFTTGPIILLVCLAVIGIAALIDFNQFFAFFHSLFFKSGSWYFSNRSLLISMYPNAFWMQMALIWLGSSTIVSVIFLLIGNILKKRSYSHDR